MNQEFIEGINTYSHSKATYKNGIYQIQLYSEKYIRDDLAFAKKFLLIFYPLTFILLISLAILGKQDYRGIFYIFMSYVVSTCLLVGIKGVEIIFHKRKLYIDLNQNCIKTEFLGKRKTIGKTSSIIDILEKHHYPKGRYYGTTYYLLMNNQKKIPMIWTFKQEVEEKVTRQYFKNHLFQLINKSPIKE